MRSLIIICLLFLSLESKAQGGIFKTEQELKKEIQAKFPKSQFQHVNTKKYDALYADNSLYTGIFYFDKWSHLCYASIYAPKGEVFDNDMSELLKDTSLFLQQNRYWISTDHKVKAKTQYNSEFKSYIYSFELL